MKTIGRSILRIIPVLFIVSFFSSAYVELLPGDPAIYLLGQERAEEPGARELVNRELRLDKDVITRYGLWLGDVVTGDLGESVKTQGLKVSETIRQRLPITLELTALALGMSLLVSVPLGVYSAYRAGRRVDRGLNTASFAAISLPQFLVGILLIFVLFNQLDWLPPQGWTRLTEWDWWDHIRRLIMPIVALSLTEIAVFQRLLRADMLATLQNDFVLTARAKGMSPVHVLFRHALRPSSFSLITLAGISAGRLIGGTVIIEQLFQIPGIGLKMIDAITSNDLVVLQGLVLLVAVFYVMFNLFVEIAYALLDPRIRRG
ncbi:MAG: ABC transporter permease [bacterium]|nr:ABC transporter permease [bacterium]MCY4162710.1 ABC transporter permease [bacterium]MCY4257610.1 ABC transporter permease [bacterium]